MFDHCGELFNENVAFKYPSPLSGWIWTLPDMRVIISDITI
jgi:hypothetical protein